MTLEDYLKTQDLEEEEIAKICNEVAETWTDFDWMGEIDPLNQVIINAFMNNEYPEDGEEMEKEIEYAIDMLRKVIREIPEARGGYR